MSAFKARQLGAIMACMTLAYVAAAPAQVNVTTYHNDNARTGQNTAETTLTPANVNTNDFGKVFTTTVNGAVYAQPLYLSNVNIAGGTHNVVYVATQGDYVYAIDATSGEVYWSVSLLPAGGTPANSSSDLYCGDIPTQVGVTGTPVIDATTGTLYVVAKSKVNANIYQYLHALNVSTGAEKFNGPVNIQASVKGSATDAVGGTLTFNARKENQRAALLLLNGQVWITWASHCDSEPWHGWVISYSASTLAQTGVYNSSPNGYANGIWMSGSGMVADPSGNVYATTGNGSWNATDRGDSLVKLGTPSAGSIPVLDYFTPHDQAALSNGDTDLSAGGLIALPPLSNGTQLLTMMGKNGGLYVVNANNLGGYCINATPACTTSDPNIVQEIPHLFSGYWGVPAYWNGNLYFGGGNDNNGEEEPIRAFSFNTQSGRVSTSATTSSALSFKFPGPDPSVSSNGTANGILWGLDNSRWQNTACVGITNCQVLYAYDATNLGNLLYTSSQMTNGRDAPGTAVKFTTPTIANGHVYVGGGGTLSAFGLLNGATPTATAPSINPGSGSYTAAQSVTLTDATPGATIYYTTNGGAPSTGSTRYTGPFTVATTTTINAIAVAPNYTTSATSSATLSINSGGTGGTSGGTASVSLASVASVDGVVASGSAVPNGGLDTHGDAYAANLLGSSVTWNGLTFSLGSAGVADVATGVTLALPAGNYAALNLLAAGVNGAQLNQAFVVTYTDGTTTTITQDLSDWYTPANYAGEAKAVTMAYRLRNNGTVDNRTFYLYGYSLAINSAKTVQSVSLPKNRNVVVLAATLSGASGSTPPPSPGAGTPEAVSLTGEATVYGAFNDGSAVTNGGLDTHEDAYSRTLLGATVTWSGTSFTLGAAGSANTASGTVIPLPTGSFSEIKLLATGVNGAQVNQGFTVTYTDGTSTVIYQSLSDWYNPASYSGESLAVTMPYRLTASGASDHRSFYLYGYQLNINPAKTAKSLTLPANRNVVVLAATMTP